MTRSILIGAFIAVQAVGALVYFTSLAPLAGPESAPFTSQTMQVWSGGARADMVDSFRREPTESAAPFEPYGSMLWSAVLMAMTALASLGGSVLFARKRPLLAVGVFALVLAGGAGAATLIITHWGGSVLYPAGSPNVAWLYMATRAFLLHLVIGYVLMIVVIALILFDVARSERPMGAHLVALNWVVIAVVWLGAYVGLYLTPALASGPAQGG